MIFAVMAAGPGSRTWRSFRLPLESSLHLMTTRARGSPVGRVVRRPSGPVRAPAWGWELGSASANCMTTVPMLVST